MDICSFLNIDLKLLILLAEIISTLEERYHEFLAYISSIELDKYLIDISERT